MTQRSQLDLFRDALRTQDTIVADQHEPGTPVDVLGRPVTPCCGELDLGDSWHGGRPYQCLHQRVIDQENEEIEA